MYRFPGTSGEHALWLAQDAKGALWRVDLSHSHTVTDPVQLLSFHAGEVPAVATCPRAHMMLTAGTDGVVRIYDYNTSALVASRHFAQPITAAIWAPLTVRSRLSCMV
jgi:cilia- and flagella-associated protein 44